MEFAVVIASVIKLGCKICRPDTVELVLHLRKKNSQNKNNWLHFFFFGVRLKGDSRSLSLVQKQTACRVRHPSMRSIPNKNHYNLQKNKTVC